MLRHIAKLVVIEHSIFALPFALSAFLIAWRSGVTAVYPNSFVATGILVILAIVLARTGAMAFNRYLDAELDGRNPRTADREIPRGVVSRAQALLLTVICSGAFILVAGLIGEHCLLLAPPVIALLLSYSWTKRFTWGSHFVLGACLGAAPGGAWWVLRPQVELLPCVLMAAVLLWVAGFDILYSCQDAEFDRAHGLRSIPARFGIGKALSISLLCHVVAGVLFVAVGLVGELGEVYLLGLLPFILLLLSQHYGLSSGNLARINRIFFTRNGLASIYYLLLILIALTGQATKTGGI